jgi:hypothetical protein
MTKEYAKELTIEVWEYFARHPEIECKLDLPKTIYNKIYCLLARCPLCEMFMKYECAGCPIKIKKENGECSLYFAWIDAKTNKGRKRAAEKIVRLVKAWKINPTTAEAGKE